MKKPSTLNYLSTWDYVAAFDLWAQKNKPGYSKRNFAKWAKIKSPNFVSLLISQKRNLKGAWLNQFIIASQLSDTEGAYLRKLSLFENAKSSKEREKILEQIQSQFNKVEFSVLAGDQLEVLTDPKVWTLYHMLDLVDQQSTPIWFKQRLRFLKLTGIQIDESFKRLKRLNLIEVKDGSFQSKQKQLVSPDQIKNQTNSAYHKKILKEATIVLDELDPTERAFGSMTATVSKDKINDLKNEINKFGKYITAKYASNESVEGEVIRLNIQLYPLTKKQNTEG